MKIFADRKIKALFAGILSCVLSAMTALALLLSFDGSRAALYVVAVFLCEGIGVLFLCVRYFEMQHSAMEDAVSQIEEYILGNMDAYIECNDEGELCRLFHEINSLAAILNAHSEREKNAKKFLQDTISDISHQLKTPLAALNIYNGILYEAEELSDIREICQMSEQELDRIETLVQNLLKLARLDAGTIVLEKSVVNVAELAAGAKRQFLFRARQEKKEIRLSGNDDVMLCCDRTWLQEAIGNLIKNALDHTDEGGLVCVEWSAFASVVRIAVRDDGCGIHREDLYHIFKRFYRSRFSKDIQGLGLGLTLTKAIVEAHNGTIEVDSELGRGTLFTMNFLV